MRDQSCMSLSIGVESRSGSIICTAERYGRPSAGIHSALARISPPPKNVQTPRRTCAVKVLMRAASIGRAAGLQHVYAGNLPGLVDSLEDTHCQGCGGTIIARYGYLVSDYRVTSVGTCPDCAMPVPGRWDARFEPQRTAHPFRPYDRTRIRVL